MEAYHEWQPLLLSARQDFSQPMHDFGPQLIAHRQLLPPGNTPTFVGFPSLRANPNRPQGHYENPNLGDFITATKCKYVSS